MCVHVLVKAIKQPTARMDPGFAVYTTLFVVVVGGVAVCWAYVEVFSKENESYTNSRFWLGISPDTATALIPLQLLAAIGFVIFVSTLILGAFKDKNKRFAANGILGYLNGFACVIILFLFFACSVVWPFAAREYLNSQQNDPEGRGSVWWLSATAGSLFTAGAMAILMVAGAFENDMHFAAIYAVLIFSTVVFLADAIGWNAKLIYGYLNPQPVFTAKPIKMML